MRCRALSGGTSLGRPAGDDNPQDRPRPGGKLSLSKKQIASFPILVSCLKKWLTHFLDELQRTLPTEVGIPGLGQGDAPVKKLVLVLTIFLVTPAHADTVTIGWWDKSIGGLVNTLSAASGPITPTSPIVDIIQHPLLLGSGFGFAQVVAMVIPPTGNVMSGGLGGPSPRFQFSFNDGFAPPQGGNIRLYATWQGVVTSGTSI